MQKRTIVVFPGNADSLFFQMELPIIRQYFDQIIMVSYHINKKDAQKLSEELGIPILVVPKFWVNPVSFIKWWFEPSVKKERSQIKGGLTERLVDAAHIFIYGQFYLNTRTLLSELFSTNKDIVLYSYWLARGAYAAAHLKEDYKESVKLAVSRAHGYDLYLERKKYRYIPFRNDIDHLLDEIWFISKQGRQYFEKLVPPTASSAKRFLGYLGTRKDSSLPEHHPNEAYPVIMSCSTINDNKRLDLIIDVIKHFAFKYSWVHIGDGPEAQSIKDLAKRVLPEGSYEFVGSIPNTEVLSTYIQKKASFFINLSDSEGLPVTIMEAASLGIPVIARDIGGISEIVSSHTGCLLGQQLPDEMSDLVKQVSSFISQAFHDHDYYQAMSSAIYRLWEEKFNADSNFNEFFSSLDRGKK